MQLEHFLIGMGFAIYIMAICMINMRFSYKSNIRCLERRLEWLEKDLRSAEKELLELRYKR